MIGCVWVVRSAAQRAVCTSPYGPYGRGVQRCCVQHGGPQSVCCRCGRAYGAALVVSLLLQCQCSSRLRHSPNALSLSARQPHQGQGRPAASPAGSGLASPTATGACCRAGRGARPPARLSPRPGRPSLDAATRPPEDVDLFVVRHLAVHLGRHVQAVYSSTGGFRGLGLGACWEFGNLDCWVSGSARSHAVQPSGHVQAAGPSALRMPSACMPQLRGGRHQQGCLVCLAAGRALIMAGLKPVRSSSRRRRGGGGYQRQGLFRSRPAAAAPDGRASAERGTRHRTAVRCRTGTARTHHEPACPVRP